MTDPSPARTGACRRTVVALCVVLTVAVPAAPAYANHTPRQNTSPTPLLRVPELLSALLPGLFPPSSSAVPASVRDRVIASTVRVSGPACGRVQVGSGFSPRQDLTVTAAHVVAGTTRTEVLRPDGRRLPATVVAFDPNRDVAVLQVDGLGQAPLPLGRATVGSPAAVFGHPAGQPQVEVSPATIAAQGTARLENLYGEGPVSREVLRLSSRLEPGDSGGPVVDATGIVVGVAFAVATTRPDVAFAVTSREVESVLSQTTTTPVSTGPCVD